MSENALFWDSILCAGVLSAKVLGAKVLYTIVGWRASFTN